MFPQPKDAPTSALQAASGVEVSPRIGFKFFDPPLSVGLRNSSVPRASVPKAAVQKHGQALPRKTNVNRPPRDTRNGIRHPEAITGLVQRRSDGEFAGVIPSASGLHPL